MPLNTGVMPYKLSIKTQNNSNFISTNNNYNNIICHNMIGFTKVARKAGCVIVLYHFSRGLYSDDENLNYSSKEMLSAEIR